MRWLWPSTVSQRSEVQGLGIRGVGGFGSVLREGADRVLTGNETHTVRPTGEEMGPSLDGGGLLGMKQLL